LSAAVDAHKPFPAVVADEPALLASLKPVSGKPNTFSAPANIFLTADEGAMGVTLKPFYQASTESYEVYWDRFTPAEWDTKKADYKNQLVQQKELDARTVDSVNAGEEQNERDHNLKEENTDTRDFNDQQFRIVSTNGWFVWELKVLPGQPQELRVVFGRGGRGPSTLELFVDDAHLTTHHAGGAGEGRGLETKVYPLSADLLKGKEKVALKFQAPPDARGGAVVNARVLKTAGKN
jgi:uncharacterized protein